MPAASSPLDRLSRPRHPQAPDRRFAKFEEIAERSPKDFNALLIMADIVLERLNSRRRKRMI